MKENKIRIKYIPIRYIFAVFLSILEIITIITIVFILNVYLPYFWTLSLLTQLVVVFTIICSKDNPDYKVPWLLVTILLPIIGYMLYFMFYKRKLRKKYIKRINNVNGTLIYDDSKVRESLKNDDKLIYTQTYQLLNESGSHVYKDTQIKYFSEGMTYYESIIDDLKKAKEFILIDFFIISKGQFWNSILSILKEKASSGVEVNVIWDDIGCMQTLPGNYYKKLQKYGINATSFSRLRGQADSEFNNRNHRKILVIDGIIGYTGGINLADEYINKKQKYGYWKDTGIRLLGNAVNELTKLFFLDFYSNIKTVNKDVNLYYRRSYIEGDSYIVPFGDGPKPIYDNNIGKMVILNILSQAKEYVYITAPYLIMDSEVTNAIKNTSLRGVDVRIIIPNIPDKKLIYEMTLNNALDLKKYGVKIYKFKPGFIHSKLYISDDKLAMIGTINLDYRSLVHHFENGVWIYNGKEILEMKQDFYNTLDKSIPLDKKMPNLFKKIFLAIASIFTPLF